MSLSNSSDSRIATDSINQYVDRVRTATRAKSKELRISITEAEDIALALTQYVLRENSLLQQINDLHDTINALRHELTEKNIDFDGGSW